jgi:GSH-dependent disulfide-bond oxidoreductase
MIDLSYWPTPNGHKVTIFLEEAEVPYRLLPVNITQGEQFQPDFLRISPNNKMPAIVDTAPADGGKPLALFESGAILEYLGMKTGRFLPTELRARANVMQWLFWQMGGLGPMLGQNHHFANYAPEKIPYAIDRYVKETARLYRVLDTQLAGRDFVADTYSIAPKAGGLPQCEALVRGHRRAAGCPTRLRTGQRGERLAPGAYRGGATSALRPGATPGGGPLSDAPCVKSGQSLSPTWVDSFRKTAQRLG